MILKEKKQVSRSQRAKWSAETENDNKQPSVVSAAVNTLPCFELTSERVPEDGIFALLFIIASGNPHVLERV